MGAPVRGAVDVPVEPQAVVGAGGGYLGGRAGSGHRRGILRDPRVRDQLGLSRRRARPARFPGVEQCAAIRNRDLGAAAVGGQGRRPELAGSAPAIVLPPVRRAVGVHGSLESTQRGSRGDDGTAVVAGDRRRHGARLVSDRAELRGGPGGGSVVVDVVPQVAVVAAGVGGRGAQQRGGEGAGDGDGQDEPAARAAARAGCRTARAAGAPRGGAGSSGQVSDHGVLPKWTARGPQCHPAGLTAGQALLSRVLTPVIRPARYKKLADGLTAWSGFPFATLGGGPDRVRAAGQPPDAA